MTTSRFSKLSSYPAAPGCCKVCGDTTRDCIDTGITDDWVGATFFCILCAQDLGRVAGLVDPIIEPPVAEVVDEDEFIPTISDVHNLIAGVEYRLGTSIQDLFDQIRCTTAASNAAGQNDNATVSKKSIGIPGSDGDVSTFVLGPE